MVFHEAGSWTALALFCIFLNNELVAKVIEELHTLIDKFPFPPYRVNK